MKSEATTSTEDKVTQSNCIREVSGILWSDLNREGVWTAHSN